MEERSKMPQPDSRYHKLMFTRFTGGSVGVLVGVEKKLFSVHEKLIRASSQFFDKAMSGAWLESAHRTIQLPEDEAEIFGIYVHWLYYGTLPVCCNDSGLPENQEYLKIVKAYTLGDKLMDTKFQNAAIDAIIEKSISAASDGNRWYPVAEVVEFAYNNTLDSSSCLLAMVTGLIMETLTQRIFPGPFSLSLVQSCWMCEFLPDQRLKLLTIMFMIQMM